jgi:hypothetical protein
MAYTTTEDEYWREKWSVAEKELELLTESGLHRDLELVKAERRIAELEAEVERLRSMLVAGVEWNKSAFGQDWREDAPDWVLNAEQVLTSGE